MKIIKYMKPGDSDFGKIEWRGKELNFNLYWVDSTAFSMDIGDRQLQEENGEPYFLHCECECENGSRKYLFQIWYKDDCINISAMPEEKKEKYLTSAEIEGLKTIIAEAIDSQFPIKGNFVSAKGISWFYCIYSDFRVEQYRTVQKKVAGGYKEVTLNSPKATKELKDYIKRKYGLEVS